VVLLEEHYTRSYQLGCPQVGPRPRFPPLVGLDGRQRWRQRVGCAENRGQREPANDRTAIVCLQVSYGFWWTSSAAPQASQTPRVMLYCTQCALRLALRTTRGGPEARRRPNTPHLRRRQVGPRFLSRVELRVGANQALSFQPRPDLTLVAVAECQSLVVDSCRLGESLVSGAQPAPNATAIFPGTFCSGTRAASRIFSPPSNLESRKSR